MRSICFLALLSLGLANLWATDSSTIAVASAANTNIGVTPDSLASVFGPNLATQPQSASAPPWPTRLGDISVVDITDSAGNTQMAGLLYVSPTQMNIWIPPGLVPGPATIAFPVTGLPPGEGTAALRTASFTLQKIAPSLFTVDATIAAATAVRVTIPTAIQTPVPVFECDAAAACAAVPIDVGVDAPVYLSLYGTGLSGVSPSSTVVVTIGNTKIQPAYAGPQMQYPGLDQVNVPLVLSLRGSGLVNVTVTVDGVTSNPVKIDIQ